MHEVYNIIENVDVGGGDRKKTGNIFWFPCFMKYNEHVDAWNISPTGAPQPLSKR